MTVRAKCSSSGQTEASVLFSRSSCAAAFVIHSKQILKMCCSSWSLSTGPTFCRPDTGQAPALLDGRLTVPSRLNIVEVLLLTFVHFSKCFICIFEVMMLWFYIICYMCPCIKLSVCNFLGFAVTLVGSHFMDVDITFSLLKNSSLLSP